jgi:hypothetical protein
MFNFAVRDECYPTVEIRLTKYESIRASPSPW